jgi:hypothetical protein
MKALSIHNKIDERKTYWRLSPMFTFCIKVLIIWITALLPGGRNTLFDEACLTKKVVRKHNVANITQAQPVNGVEKYFES